MYWLVTRSKKAEKQSYEKMATLFNPKVIMVSSATIGFLMGAALFYFLDAKIFRSSASHVFLVVGGLLGLALGL